MALRPRLDDDLEQCVRLLADVHREDGYPTYWPDDPVDWLSPRRMLGALVAEERGRIAGHIALAAVASGRPAATWSEAAGVPTAGLASISRLFVAHDARGAGTGAALLEAACIDAERRGLRAVLDVVETNRDAIRLYERHGCRRVHSEPWSEARGEQLTLHYFVSARPDEGRAPRGRPPRTRAG